uniref:Uncharacterized protein n=1 Tax=Vitis vinifera TaxID=29760 RepID=F6HCP9_VITVI
MVATMEVQVITYPINTCNSFYCDQFTPNSPNKPKMWTENWPGWHCYY